MNESQSLLTGYFAVILIFSYFDIQFSVVMLLRKSLFFFIVSVFYSPTKRGQSIVISAVFA